MNYDLMNCNVNEKFITTVEQVCLHEEYSILNRISTLIGMLEYEEIANHHNKTNVSNILESFRKYLLNLEENSNVIEIRHDYSEKKQTIVKNWRNKMMENGK